MAAMQLISLMLLSVLAADAQVAMPGRCPKPAVHEDFDTARYLGKWDEMQRLPQSVQRGQCSTATYSLRSPGVVLNREPDSPPGPYWVLASDYDNYALVYSCTGLGVVHMDSVWILSRRPALAEETLEELHSTLTSISVRADQMISPNQDAAHARP
ncbi:apolipoprotein Da, duplicate 2 [Dunckerocampus dactyliophorus]|uniref:apolipoprotein Da, duplicate 2 n=1 Tax=Dunckerocampus dactyliophorus TaxID=161453 RepID=UPI002406D3B5|nr:apolipoprotein Da, duplicate 2 [Dunckerocampus dactyliophorus]